MGDITRDDNPYIIMGYTKYYFVMQDNLSKGLTYNDDMAITVGQKTLVKDEDYQLTVLYAEGRHLYGDCPHGRDG